LRDPAARGFHERGIGGETPAGGKKGEAFFHERSWEGREITPREGKASSVAEAFQERRVER
jgi:hypothetical protein